MDSVFSSTTQLAAAIRAGHVSATEVLQAHLEQIATHNAALNAIITMDAERAYERAREADEALARGEVCGPLHVDGQEVSYWMVSAHSTVFNYTGHPAVVLPYQLDHDGLPIGVQLVGKRWDESRLLAMAKALSEVTGAFQRPPGY